MCNKAVVKSTTDEETKREATELYGRLGMSLNRVVISGNLTRDPEMRATTSGMQVLSFGDVYKRQHL